MCVIAGLRFVGQWNENAHVLSHCRAVVVACRSVVAAYRAVVSRRLVGHCVLFCLLFGVNHPHFRRRHRRRRHHQLVSDDLCLFTSSVVADPLVLAFDLAD